jgi:hypothetical protein
MILPCVSVVLLFTLLTSHLVASNTPAPATPTPTAVVLLFTLLTSHLVASNTPAPATPTPTPTPTADECYLQLLEATQQCSNNKILYILHYPNPSGFGCAFHCTRLRQLSQAVMHGR